MDIIKNKRILALVGIVGIILGMLLPYYTIEIDLWYGSTSSTSVSLWGYWEGKVIFILTLACALIIFKDVIEKYVPQLFNNAVGRIVEKVNNPKFALVPTALVTFYAIYLIVNLGQYKEYIKYGIGFYVLWIGIIALIGHAILYKKQKSSVQTGMNANYMQQPMQQTMNNGYVQQPMQQQVNPSYVQPSIQPQTNMVMSQQQIQQPMNSGYVQQPMQAQMNMTMAQPQVQQQMSNGFSQQPMQQQVNSGYIQPSIQPQTNIAASQQGIQQQNTLKKYCPNCKTQLDANAEVCFICGTKL